MAEHKDYGLVGAGRTLQLGKQGPLLVGNADTDSFSVTLQDASTLTNMSGANAVNNAHFITKAQLDVVYTEAVFKANVNYNDSSPILLGNISSGTKTIITTFTVSTAFDANAVVTIGTSANANLLMSDNYAEIEVVGTYQTINTVEFASNSALNIYVTQGGATQGAGTVLVSVVDGPVVNGGTINYGAGGGSVDLTDLSVTSNSPSGNGSLSYNNTTGVFTFTPADASLSNYGNSNVVTLLSSFGSNSISTIGNISANAFVLPGGGTITENVYGFAGSIRLKPIGGSATQYLEIAPTGGGDGDHVHLMSGGGTTELFLGDDNQYVKLASNGAIVVNSANVSSGNSAQWTFGTNGALTLPGNSFTVNYANGSQVSLGGGGIALANLSVSVNSPSGNGSLTYSNSTGVFTFTPANLSSVAGNYGNSNVVTLLSSLGSNTIVTTGNITAGNILTSAEVIASGVIQSGTGLSTGGYLSVDGAADLHNTTVTGNISATGNVTANNFIGNISITGNVTGTSANVSLVAGSYSTVFDNTGAATFPGNITTSGNISATGSILSTPAWTSAGAITFTATTTNPTKGTTTSDNISYRQLGAKQWEVILTYIQTVANGVSGSGDYLFTLPNSLSFDTTLPSQQITTTNIGTNTYALMSYIIPSGSGLINNDSLGGQVYPIVYDATKFRILTTSWGNAIQCWGSGYYSLGGDDPKIQLTFRFTST